MVKRLMLTGLLGVAVAAAMPITRAQQGSLVHTPITDPGAFLAGRNNQPAAPARNVESAADHARRVISRRDYEIREMNRRIDEAGRR